jgi:hypothetical protein
VFTLRAVESYVPSVEYTFPLSFYRNENVEQLETVVSIIIHILFWILWSTFCYVILEVSYTFFKHEARLNNI